MGSIYQRSNSRVWQASYEVDGKRVQESTGTRNKREAERFLAARVTDVQRGAFVRPVKITLPELGARYVAWAETRKRSWRRDVQMLGHLKRFFGDAMLSDISSARVEAYQQHRMQEVAPATVNRETALLKHMFNVAERWGLRQGPNPVRFVKFLDERNLKFQTLSDDEERRLLSAAPPYLQELILFALNSGLRSGDLFALTWEEVDIEQRRLNLIVQKSQRMLEVPLNDNAWRIVEGRHAIRQGPYVFYNMATGDRFKDVKFGLQQAVKRAGLPKVTFHTFRHTFASRLTRGGVDIVTVKELLGHSTITVTMRYAHSNEETKRRAVATVAHSEKVVTVLPRRQQVARFA